MRGTSPGFQAETIRRRLRRRLDHADELRDLVYAFSRVERLAVLYLTRRLKYGERAPLAAVNRPQFALFVGPLVADGHPVFIQVADIRVAGKEPQKFMDDRAQVQPFRRYQRETVCEAIRRL